MLASLFSKPQSLLSVQAKRLVAMRFLIYTGFQTSYFIGVIGTLTYADDASVVATSLAVLFMNVFVILGSFAGGAALDVWGPRRHFLLSIVGALATGTAIIAFGSATGIVLLGAVFLGLTMGFAQPIATSYPAYLTDDPVELKDINSAIAMFSNVSIIVGPTLGGFVAAAASSRAVFVLMMLFTVLALIAGWGFKPRAGQAAGYEDEPAAGDITSDKVGQSPNSSASSASPSRPASRRSLPTAFSPCCFASFFFRTLAMEPSTRSSRSSIAMSCMSALSGWAGSRLLRAWARCWVPCSRSACRRTWSTLKRCLWRLCPWAWEVCSMWGRVRGRGPRRPDRPGHSLGCRQSAPQHHRANDGAARATRPCELGHGLWQYVRRRGAAGDCPVAGGDIGVQRTLVGAGMVVTAVPAALLLFGRNYLERAVRQ